MSKNQEKQSPAGQPFQGPVRRNLTKKNSWWAKAPFHNNKIQKPQSQPKK